MGKVAGVVGLALLLFSILSGHLYLVIIALPLLVIAGGSSGDNTRYSHEGYTDPLRRDPLTPPHDLGTIDFWLDDDNWD